MRDASLRGWIAELSNQLLGRIKNKLLAHGVTELPGLTHAQYEALWPRDTRPRQPSST